MFCDSNDTTLISCGLACFENTHAKRSTYFGQKSWFPHEFRINVKIFKLSINGPRGCSAIPMTQPSPHVDSPASRTLMPNEAWGFGQKSWFPHMNRTNVQIFKLSIKWIIGDVLLFQAHNPHLMSARLLREDSSEAKHLFWANIMISPCVPEKRANF